MNPPGWRRTRARSMPYRHKKEAAPLSGRLVFSTWHNLLFSDLHHLLCDLLVIVLDLKDVSG